nr:Coenzyme F420 hydrogenase/dehydrogenase, beta subunit C-terminal domain [Mitsuokella multacida]
MCHQCGALRQFLGKQNQENLVLVEVICEGVPAPAFIEKQIEYWEKKQGDSIIGVDYRFKAGNRWDYEPMRYRFAHGLVKVQDRWFNPFWSIWLQHLMSRPSCYHCPYCSRERVADITLGDLWGVHIYCPDRYNANRGCSLIIANTEKGQRLFAKAKKLMNVRELDMNDVIRFQGPMRGHISMNPKRAEFMHDLSRLSYQELCRHYAKRPSLKLLIHKYIWGTNRQKVWWWGLKRRIGRTLRGLKR